MDVMSPIDQIGINTYSPKHKNPNLQGRPDPPIEKVIVSPWGNTPDMQNDPYARGLEIVGPTPSACDPMYPATCLQGVHGTASR